MSLMRPPMHSLSLQSLRIGSPYICWLPLTHLYKSSRYLSPILIAPLLCWILRPCHVVVPTTVTKVVWGKQPINSCFQFWYQAHLAHWMHYQPTDSVNYHLWNHHHVFLLKGQDWCNKRSHCCITHIMLIPSQGVDACCNLTSVTSSLSLPWGHLRQRGFIIFVDAV